MEKYPSSLEIYEIILIYSQQTNIKLPIEVIMTNPLLTPTTLPQFSKIKPEHVVPAIEELLSICKETTEKLLQQKEYSWENFCLPLEEVND